MRLPSVRLSAVAAVSSFAISLALLAGHSRLAAAPDAVPADCAQDNGGLTLPPGFCATVFADHLGHTRHLTVGSDGTIYANTWDSEDYFPHNPAPAGGFVVALKDRDGDGVADVIERFGSTPRRGGQGGTGIALWHGAIYAEEGSTIVRYPLTPGQMSPGGAPELVLSGLVLGGDHPMHPFVIDAMARFISPTMCAARSGA